MCVFLALVGHSFHRCVFHCYYGQVRFTPAIVLWIIGVYTLISACACFRSPLLLLFYLFLCSFSSILLFSFSCLFVHLFFTVFHVLVWSFLFFICIHVVSLCVHVLSVCVCVCVCVCVSVILALCAFSYLFGVFTAFRLFALST